MSIGLEVPEDLRLLAANEQDYKERQFKQKHGIEQDNLSSQLLKEALAAGQKHKAGIGFKRPDKRSQNLNTRPADEQDSQELYGEYKSMIETIKNKEMQIMTQELMGKGNGVPFEFTIRNMLF